MRAPELRHRTLRRQRTPDTGAPLLLAQAAVEAARMQLDRYALETDATAWQVVDAADLLEAAHHKLADAAKGAP